MEEYRHCTLCPRYCRVDRTRAAARGPGVCGETAVLRLASACLHFGEEPVLTGRGGSGTLFFTGCSLGCVFCQNHQLSRGGFGAPVSVEELARLMLRLQEEGAANINLVTGSHFIPHILAALEEARAGGLGLPIVWNCSGYETLESLERLLPVVDIFLPDLKTLDGALSGRLFRAPDYPEVARAAILKMSQQPLRFGPAPSVPRTQTPQVPQTQAPVQPQAPRAEAAGGEELLRSGLIVRHLVLPEELESTRRVLEWFAGNLKERALLSLMFQYTPMEEAGGPPAPAEAGRPGDAGQSELSAAAPARAGSPRGRTAPDRRVNRREVRTVLGWLEELGIEEGFIQEAELEADERQWLPDFRRINPFAAELSRVIWHPGMQGDARR